MEQQLDIYLRVSRKRDDKQLSLDGQEADSRARVAEVGARVGQVHRDDGRSAWNPRVRRDGWEALMTRLEDGATDGVCVFDMERFTRQPIEGERLLKAAERGLVVLDSDAAYNLQSASGRKAFRDHMSAAAYYSDKLSHRIKRGKKLKASKGEVDARRSFGFREDGETQRPDEVKVIRELAERLLTGESQVKLEAELAERGILSVNGKPWSRNTIRYMMTRPRNAGYVAHNDKIVPGVRLPGKPILDENTYNRIIALFTARRPGRPNSGRYVLSGIAHCGRCGRALVGRPRSHLRYPDGEVRRQYWCNTSVGGCGRLTIDLRALETWTMDWAIRVLSDPEHADALARAGEEYELAWERLLAESSSIEATLVEMAGRLGRQEISLARHDAVSGPLDARLLEIAVERAELAADEPPAMGRQIPERDKAWLGWLEVATSGTVAERRAMVIRALGGRRLVIGPGKPALFDPDRVTVRP